MYVNRNYREALTESDLKVFSVKFKETDLFIFVDLQSYSEQLVTEAERLVLALRHDLEEYISIDPEFKTTLQPHIIMAAAPPIAQTMAKAGNIAGVGPMAAVAGAFAEFVGRHLLLKCSEVIVENGGDIFAASQRARRIQIFAGASPFSNRLAVELTPDKMPLGICTSSGTVGPSLSFGKADAAVILSSSTALADAVASAAGNVVKSAADVKKGVEVAKSVPEVLGAVIIKDDQMAAWGDVNLIPVG